MSASRTVRTRPMKTKGVERGRARATATATATAAKGGTDPPKTVTRVRRATYQSRWAYVTNASPGFTVPASRTTTRRRGWYLERFRGCVDALTERHWYPAHRAAGRSPKPIVVGTWQPMPSD